MTEDRTESLALAVVVRFVNVHDTLARGITRAIRLQSTMNKFRSADTALGSAAARQIDTLAMW